MSIYFIDADMLKLDKCNIVLCHQVNCMGVMGGGIALSIKLLYPHVYNCYNSYCIQNKYSEYLLRQTQIIPIDIDKHIYIANLFSQYRYGRDKCHTDYSALETCLSNVRHYCYENNLQMAVPNKIGCGLAGGDWNIVKQLLIDMFETAPVDLFVCELK